MKDEITAHLKLQSEESMMNTLCVCVKKYQRLQLHGIEMNNSKTSNNNKKTISCSRAHFLCCERAEEEEEQL